MNSLSCARYVAVEFKSSALLPDPLFSIAGVKKVSQLSHKPNVEDLIFIKKLIEAERVVPVIDRQYPLSRFAEAIQYFVEGNTSGKIVITVEDSNKI